MAGFDIAVVIPARNAAATLPAALAAVAGTTHPGPVEVVVVDDASTDATAALAEAAGVRVVRLVRQGGPAAARNAGIAATSAPLLAFTDADCAPTPGWLGALAAGLRAADLVTGPVLPDPARPAGPWDRTLHNPTESLLYETANLAVRREVAERVGGFVPFAPGPGAAPGLRPRVEEGHFGEDAVFAWRARRGRARTAFLPEAVVHHAVHPRSARAFVAEHWRLRFFPALVRELPELGAALPRRGFLNARTARFDLAAAGVLAAVLTRRPLLVGATLPYVRAHLEPGPPWRGTVLRRNLTLVAADAVALAALVTGSVAARRPVL